MRKATTILVEDEDKNMKLLDHFLSKYCPQVKVVGRARSVQEAVALIDELKPKLIMLDIQLNDATGFDVLDAIEHLDFRVIFVTSYSDHAVKAFKYNAIDYILKPLSVEDLVVAVNKAYEDIERDFFNTPEQLLKASKTVEETAHFDFIAVPSMDKIEFIKLENIVYLKSDGRYTAFKLTSGNEILASKNLGEFENIVDKSQFFRIHNSYIVNLRHVQKINKADGSYCEMSNKEALPIAKRRQDSLSRFLRIKD